jgi:hypothetical protein
MMMRRRLRGRGRMIRREAVIAVRADERSGALQPGIRLGRHAHRQRQAEQGLQQHGKRDQPRRRPDQAGRQPASLLQCGAERHRRQRNAFRAPRRLR